MVGTHGSRIIEMIHVLTFTVLTSSLTMPRAAKPKARLSPYPTKQERSVTPEPPVDDPMGEPEPKTGYDRALLVTLVSKVSIQVHQSVSNSLLLLSMISPGLHPGFPFEDAITTRSAASPIADNISRREPITSPWPTPSTSPRPNAETCGERFSSQHSLKTVTGHQVVVVKRGTVQ